MGKLIVWNVISIDGFFEGDQPWDLRLHEHIWGEDLRSLSMSIGEEAGLIVFGRTTYEGMASHWPTDTDEPEIAEYMNAIPKLVASHTLTEPAWNKPCTCSGSSLLTFRPSNFVPKEAPCRWRV